MSKVTRLLTKKQVKEIVSLSFAHTARLEALGLFPRRIRLTDHPRGRCAYAEDEIQAWVQHRISQTAS